MDECNGLEKRIVLFLGKKTYSISEISKGLDKDIHTISKIISIMFDRGLIEKFKSHAKDSRSWNIKLKRDNVKIRRFARFYIWFFIPFILYNLLSIGTAFYYGLWQIFSYLTTGFLVVFFYMGFNMAKDEDKVTVYKRS